MTVLPYGVGATDCTAVLTRDGPGSSIYGGKGQFGQVDVEIRDIVGVLEELDLYGIDVLKVNIEGAEYDLLERLVAARVAAADRDALDPVPRVASTRSSPPPSDPSDVARPRTSRSGATAGCGSCGSADPSYEVRSATSSASSASRSARRAGSFAQFESSFGSVSRS